ncbi:MAG: hypothetical protein HY360_03710 [Verrucomicrobia bacterium]|nr:hypothetical protein [Verrucomicrobiota bacterium]
MLIVQTPLRVSLAGVPTDLPRYADRFGGKVIGFGIEMPFQIEQDGTRVVFHARRPMWKTIA